MNGWMEKADQARGRADGLTLTLTIRHWEEVADDVRTFPSPDEETRARPLLISRTLETPEDGSRPGYLFEGRRGGTAELAAFVLAPETLADHRVTVQSMTSKVSPEGFLKLYRHHRALLQSSLEQGLKAFVRYHGPGPADNPAWQLEKDSDEAAASLHELNLRVRRTTRGQAMTNVDRARRESVNIRNVVESTSHAPKPANEPVLEVTLLLGRRVVCVLVNNGDETINGRTTEAQDTTDLAAFTRAHSPRDILTWMVETALGNGAGRRDANDSKGGSD